MVKYVKKKKLYIRLRKYVVRNCDKIKFILFSTIIKGFKISIFILEIFRGYDTK